MESEEKTKHACAACRYHRRKCRADCILAPYFPYETHWNHFLNAYLLFGTNNITKIITTVAPPDRNAAVHSIIFHSNARAADPVRGCLGIISDLERQIDHAEAELATVRRHLALFHHHQAPKSDAADDIHWFDQNLDS